MRVESNVIGKALKERTWHRDSRLHTFIIYYCVVKNPQCASVDDRMIIPPKERERKKKGNRITELSNNPGISPPDVFQNYFKNSGWQRQLYTHVCSSVFHNNQKVQTTEMSINI